MSDMRSEEKIAVVTDSTCDIEAEKLKNRGIRSLPLKVIIEDEQYLDRVNITPSRVYEIMEEKTPTTSMPSPGEIEELYKKLGDEGYTHIISVHISGGLSATCDNCHLVASRMDEMEVSVIDSGMLSMGLGRLVLFAQDLVDEGKPGFSEIVERVRAKKDEIKLYFVVKTLKYLKAGGRIGKVSGTIGELLNIKPIIAIDEEGEYYTAEKVRGRAASLNKMAELIEAEMEETAGYALDIMHADAGDEAEKIREKFKDKDPIREINVGQISPVMVVHAGPGLLGMALCKI